MKRLISILWMLMAVFYCAAQNTLYTCNSKYKITLPNKLELQSSELNSVKRLAASQVGIKTLSGHITFQQKGLNSNTKEAYNKYVRVIVEYFEEDRQDPTYGIGDKVVVNKDVLYAVNEAAEANCKASKTPLIKVISVEPLTINGFPTLYFSYKRKGWEGKQPPVIVNVYRIFNKYESVTLTFSYRESERELWNSIHSNIIKSFTFYNKYK
ncbi:hypothetical protein [Prevotella sp. P6B4]|uniref:hypothetical protein n=1 Tax=Prevotella sp. P6B4 TaxID=1410614 RepID=UPI0012DEF4CA|nr:hypothetical protein [Prevotella sp. P6B4]